MEAYGTLVVRVYTSRAQIPVGGATVAVTRRAPEGGRELLAVRVSDGSGRTAPVRLATPGRQESASPGVPHPFAVCDVWAQAEGYEGMAVENVQVFSGTETLQELELIPLPEHAPAGESQPPVDIPPQSL